MSELMRQPVDGRHHVGEHHRRCVATLCGPVQSDLAVHAIYRIDLGSGCQQHVDGLQCIETQAQ